MRRIIVSKLLISPPRHVRYWAVKPIVLMLEITGGGATIPPQKNSCKGNFTLGARGFSCAVSGFGQVLKSDFAARVFCTREKKPLVPKVGKLVFKKNPARGDT